MYIIYDHDIEIYMLSSWRQEKGFTFFDLWAHDPNKAAVLISGDWTWPLALESCLTPAVATYPHLSLHLSRSLSSSTSPPPILSVTILTLCSLQRIQASCCRNLDGCKKQGRCMKSAAYVLAHCYWPLMEQFGDPWGDTVHTAHPHYSTLKRK